MTITLEIPEQDEADAVRTLVGDLRDLVKLRLRRPDITAARIVGAGKILNVFDEIEQQLPPPPATNEAPLAAAA